MTKLPVVATKLVDMMPRPNRRDALVAVAFLGWALIEIIAGTISGSMIVNVSAAVVSTTALAWRRSAPVAAGLICAAGLTVKTALGLELDGTAMISAILVAAYSVGRQEPRLRAAMTAGGMVLLAWISLFGLPVADRNFSNYPFIAVWVGAPCLAGAALRFQIAKAELLAGEAARAAMQRDEKVQLAVRVERGRIARELHDTVAHAVSVMVLHTGAVRSRLPDSLDSEKRALEQSEQTGRLAIAELGRLLGVLRSDADGPAIEPQPTLSHLDELLEHTRRQGLAVSLDVKGNRRQLEPGLDASAYRIVQEALTNVRKHSQAHDVRVRVAFDGDWLRLRIADDGIGANGHTAGGFGLVGIRERAEVYGGTISVSSPAGGGFVLDAALPVRPL